MNRMPESFLAILIPLFLSLNSKARTWTDTSGRTMDAGLVSYAEEGREVAILKEGREYTIPLEKFSQADKAYILQEHAKTSQPPSQRAKELVGLHPSTGIVKRAFPSPESYLRAPNVREFVDAFKWGGGTPLDNLGYDPLHEKIAVYVPENYDHTTPFGVYVAISPSPKAWLPDKAYQELFKKHRIISVSAHDAGNGQGLFRRSGLALDGLATVRLLHKTDPSRYYVGGVSGGGGTATQAHFLYPGHFKASFNIVRGSLPDLFEVPVDVPGQYKKGQVFGNTWPYLTNEKWKRIALERPDSRWAFLSGPKDFNYEFAKASAPQWRGHGFQSEFFDVPGLGHQNVPAKWFEKALLWAEGKAGE
jgi:hypothetical protein